MSFTKEEAEATYRSLGLGRAPLRLDAESTLQEKRIALGGEAPEYPRVLIGRRRYEEVLNGLVSSQILSNSSRLSPFPAEFLKSYYRERLRFAAYDKLLQEQEPRGESASAPQSADRRAHLYRRVLVQRLLTHIERRRVNSRPWLDLVWQKVVGPRIAAESQLVRIDRDAQRVVLRSLNSSLAFSLRRRPDLASQLSAALGVPVREIRLIA